MSEQTMELARRGMRAWSEGNLDTLESLLDADVRWRWFEPGEWDCRNRADVMRVIRERFEQGFHPGRLDLIDAGGDRVIVVAHPRDVGGEGWPEETATVVTFRDGKIADMQDHRTRLEALDAVGLA